MQKALNTVCAVKDSSHCVAETKWAGRHGKVVILVSTAKHSTCSQLVKAGIIIRALLQ